MQASERWAEESGFMLRAVGTPWCTPGPLHKPTETACLFWRKDPNGDPFPGPAGKVSWS